MDLKFTSLLFRYQPFLYYRKYNGRLIQSEKLKSGREQQRKVWSPHLFPTLGVPAVFVINICRV